MNRLHLHMNVPDLARSIQFYATLFGAQPTVLKDDYAKWMLDDPRVNFAISERGRAPGIDHVGIQTDTRPELAVLADRLKAAGETTFDQEATACCYARSDKSWVTDPAGVRWETFFTFGEAVTYGEEPEAAQADAAAGPACCGAPAPKTKDQAAPASCCAPS
jgi:catechol 2,3-dioxygenase-like lactoylglutathione lyase family enzyme